MDNEEEGGTSPQYGPPGQFPAAFPGYPYMHPAMMGAPFGAYPPPMHPFPPMLPHGWPYQWMPPPGAGYPPQFYNGGMFPGQKQRTRAARRRATSKPPEDKKTSPEEDPEVVEHDAGELAKKWVQIMNTGGEERTELIKNAYTYATESQISSRAMQQTLESVEQESAAAFARGLKDHVQNTIQNKHGNFVIEKIIELLGAEDAGFVVTELSTQGAFYSRHRYGCRVLAQLLQHLSRRDKNLCALVEEILQDTEALIRHNYGYHVILSIVEYGLPEHKHSVSEALLETIFVSASYRNASFIIQKVLTFSDDIDRESIISRLLLASDADQLVKLANSKCGCHVVMEVLNLDAQHSNRMVEFLRANLDKFTTTYGKKVAEKVAPQGVHGAWPNYT